MKAGKARMIVKNNAEIDVAELKEKLVSIVAEMPAEPDIRTLVGSLRSVNSIHQTSINNNVEKMLELNGPRLIEPTILRKKPLKWVPLLKRIFFIFDSFIFSRQRQTAIHVSEICEKLCQQQETVIEAIELLSIRIEAQKDREHE